MVTAGDTEMLNSDRIIAVGLMAAVLIAVGGGTAEWVEHRAPWGLSAQKRRVEESIPRREMLARNEQLRVDKIVVATWDTALRACGQARSEDALQQLHDLEVARRTTATSRSAAYRLGRASCGVNNASPTTEPGSDSGPAPVGLPDGDTDLAAVLAGASYRPAAR